MTATNTSTQHVFRGRGDHSACQPICNDLESCVPRIPTIADLVRGRIMSREVVCARDDLDVPR